MVLLLAFLALLLAFVAFMTLGDAPQMVFKPPRWLVRVVFQSRYVLIGLSMLLYLTAIIIHLIIAPINIVVLVVIGVLLVTLIFGAVFAVPRLLFPAIQRSPIWISREQATTELAPDDFVLGIEVHGDARAYPTKWIMRPHIVCDSIGGEAVTMTYCMLSNLGKAFHTEIDGKNMQLEVVMQLENNLVYYDRIRKQLIQQINGAVLAGKEARQPPTEYSTRSMPWSAWSTLYPTTRVFYNPPQPSRLSDRLVEKLLAVVMRAQYNMQTSRPAFPTIKHFDARMHPKRSVIGVEHNGKHKAYSLEYLASQRVVNDVVDDLPVVAIYDSTHDIVDVFERTHNGAVLTFHPISTSPDFVLQDEESQSQWNIKGEAIAGPAQGQRLQSYPHASRVLWMVWSNFFPDTQLAQR